jgi:DNA-binding NarL/FixJ family response regulator
VFDAIILAPSSDGHTGDSVVEPEYGQFAEPLTPREVQVLELLAEGMPNKAIAQALGISDQTVKFHVSSISGKLGAANRTDIVRRAVRRGLIAL